ncbi:saccharopine dehydrogenase family protein [Oleiphilus messinensis]|nr:saccharopine dehydrogenase NADP-binding domain-containing protein [Oleiphilus messinensis]
MARKNRIMILGAGRIGCCIARILQHSKKYKLTVADSNTQALTELKQLKFAVLTLDFADSKTLRNAFQGYDAIISAAPFHFNVGIAKAALKAGLSYFDLTEDVATTKAIRLLSSKAKNGQIFMPQCGLAPGFIGILGNALGLQFEQLQTLKLRVGALPEFPTNQLMYNLTWSTEGLINEYCNPCEAISQGEYCQLKPLEGLETFSLDGKSYEAFNTSGGLGTLCETLAGKVSELTYKTIRFQGHRYLMDFLINGLHLGDSGKSRDLLREIFETAIAKTQQDVVIVFVTATGYVQGKLMQRSAYYKIYHGVIAGDHWSAIQIATASSMCGVIDMHFEGQLPRSGFVRQEDVPFRDYIKNPFCKPLAQARHQHA